MTKITCLNDELGQGGINELGYEQVVYWYENWGYEGGGQLVGFDGTTFHVHNLGHCSCNSPLEGDGQEYTVAELSNMLYNPDVLCNDIRQEIVDYLITPPVDRI